MHKLNVVSREEFFADSLSARTSTGSHLVGILVEIDCATGLPGSQGQ